MSFVAKVEGSHALQYRINMHQRLPLLWGASGKSILAYLPDSTVNRILETGGPSPASQLEPPTSESLWEELEVVRANEYAASNGEKLPGARGVAAPVFGPKGVIGSLIVTGPYERMKTQEQRGLAAAVVASASELSATLSGASTQQRGEGQ